MSTSAASLNVLRWSALGLGLIYGLYHQRTLSQAASLSATKKEWHDQESLIAKAKQEFARKQNGGSKNGVEKVLGLDDKGFDLDKWFVAVGGGAAKQGH